MRATLHSSRARGAAPAPPRAALASLWPRHRTLPGKPVVRALAASNGNQGSQAATNGDRSFDYEVFVIGGGSAGVRCARVAATRGARVALCELPMAFVSSDAAGGVGGTCVLRGCVPKKLLLYASEAAADLATSRDLGWQLDGSYMLDWDDFLAAKRAKLESLNRSYTDALKRAGVEVFEGRGRVADPHTVDLGDGRRFTAGNIVIATGGRSSQIPIPGAEHCITSDYVLELPRCPKKVVLVGGGYIGVEFAGMFRRLGAEVHVISRGPLPLAPRFDLEVCRFALDQYRAAGIHVHVNCSPVEVTPQVDDDSDGSAAGADGGGGAAPRRGALRVRVQRQPPAAAGGSAAEAGAAGPKEFVIAGVDEVVLAVGRGGKAAGIGLEEAGVKLGPKGSLPVDEYSRTNVPSIWAIGDVTGRIALTPVANMEGEALARTLTGEPTRPDHEGVPSAVFSLPFIATVGLTEEQAADRHARADVYTKAFTPLKCGLPAAGAPPRPRVLRAGAAAGFSPAGGEESDSSDGGGEDGGSDGGGEGAGRAFVKVLVDADSDRVLGIHMVGHDAPEAIQGFAAALKAGITKAQLDATVGIHPTAAEEVVQMRDVARTVGRAAKAGGGGGAAEGARGRARGRDDATAATAG